MEITKREVLVSIAIAAILLAVGFFISDKITDWENDQNAEYQKAIHIDDTELFKYGIRTNVGNAFVYGDLKAVDPVTFQEIGGAYMWVEKTEEHYNRHTRTVTKTRVVNGKTQTYTDTEVYYSWDYYDSWKKYSKKLNFCGVEFDYKKIDMPGSKYIDTQKEGLLSNVRYVYRGVKADLKGTIYTQLGNGSISDNSKFYQDMTAEEALRSCTTEIWRYVFWVVWILIICGSVAGFCYLENRWLE